MTDKRVKNGANAPTIGADSSWLVIDPGFKGAFPLVGLACEEVARERRGAQQCLHLRFADVPMQQQNEIVGQINRLQLRLAS